jgi:hypothetical protein
VDKPEKILILGAEEGSITLYGVKLNNEWHFLLKYEKAVPVDRDNNVNIHVEQATFQRGFHNAVKLLDEYPWYMLIPRMIHPEFAEQILTEVEKFRLTYWRRLVARSLSLTKMIH